MAANGSWFEVEKKDFFNYWNFVFVVRSRIPTWDVQRGETIFHGSIIQKPVFILHLTCTPHVPVLPATPCSLSTETLVQKLLVYMKHFLIRLEIDTFSLYKLDGNDRLFCLRIEI